MVDALQRTIRATLATDADIAEREAKLDALMAERAENMNRRRDLVSNVASNRMAMIPLLQQIEGLRRTQRNLQAVLEGRSPATGWEGGVYRVL